MSISKIVVSGRVIKAPEKRFTPTTNVAVTEFVIAVETPARQGGAPESHPMKVITWRDLAERCAQEIKKGDLVAVDGRLQINSFTTAEGQRRRDPEIDASNVENLTKTLSGGGAGQHEESDDLVKAGSKPAKRPQGNQDIEAIFASEDEIPF